MTSEEMIEFISKRLEKYIDKQIKPLKKRVEELGSLVVDEKCSDCQEKARNEQLEDAIDKIYEILVQVL